MLAWKKVRKKKVNVNFVTSFVKSSSLKIHQEDFLIMSCFEKHFKVKITKFFGSYSVTRLVRFAKDIGIEPEKELK